MEKDNDVQPADERKQVLRRADIGTRAFLIRRQNLVYMFLIAVGVHFVVRSMLGEPTLASEGAAFIMIGGVGLIMALTTMDIGQSLKEAVREEGSTTRAVLRDMHNDMNRRAEEHNKRIEARLERMDKRMEERDKRMEEHNKRVEARLEVMDKRMEEHNKRLDARLEVMDKRMEEHNKRLDAHLGQINASIEAMARQNTDLLKRMIETQNRILDKMP